MPWILASDCFCSAQSAFLCAVNCLFCINFQMSLLIASSGNFCHCTLHISPLPVTICSIRSGYFSLSFFRFLSVTPAALCKKLVIPFMSFSNLSFSCPPFYTHAHYLFLCAFGESVWCVTCENLWILVFYKVLFCFAIASEQISDGSQFISLLPYQRDLVTCSLRGFLVPLTRKLLLHVYHDCKAIQNINSLTFSYWMKIIIEIT